MKKIIPVVILIAVVVGVYLSVRNRTPKEEGVIRVSGNIEVTDAALSFKVAGRVSERLVSEGDHVKKDQVAARLDDTDLKQETDLRRAELEAASAALNELEAGSRPEEVAQSQAVLARAEAERNRWKQDYERQQKLFDRHVISQRELESARSAFETSQARVTEASKSYNLVKEGPRREQIEQARAQQKRAQEALSLAETRLGYATLNSPLDGIVLSENIEAGEYVSAGTPIVTVAKMDAVWLRAYINETDLGRVQVGQPVKVTTDSYPNQTYQGQVSFIASESEFTPKNVQTEKERVKLVYRIKIDIANPESRLKPGMPADGEIRLSPSR